MSKKYIKNAIKLINKYFANQKGLEKGTFRSLLGYTHWNASFTNGFYEICMCNFNFVYKKFDKFKNKIFPKQNKNLLFLLLRHRLYIDFDKASER